MVYLREFLAGGSVRQSADSSSSVVNCPFQSSLILVIRFRSGQSPQHSLYGVFFCRFPAVIMTWAAVSAELTASFFDDVFEYERKSVKQCALCIDFVVFTVYPAHFTRRFSYRSRDKDHVVPTVPVPATLLKEPHSFKVQNDSTMSAHNPSTRSSELRKAWYPPPERRRLDQDLFKTFEATHATLHELPKLPTGSDLLRCTAIRWRSRRATLRRDPAPSASFLLHPGPGHGASLKRGTLNRILEALQLDFFYLRILTLIPAVHLVVLHCRRARPHHRPRPRPSLHHHARTGAANYIAHHRRLPARSTRRIQRPSSCTRRPRLPICRDVLRRVAEEWEVGTDAISPLREQQPSEVRGGNARNPRSARRGWGIMNLWGCGSMEVALGSAGVWIGCTYEDVMRMAMTMAMTMGTERRWGCGRGGGRRLAGKTVK
ncbi:hypothetical protein B0H13DRAFT_2295521 [Mycena leptocephala]|nr:hypothetical protein B0H13DRAFT_2295521 [Mycena leptocephala]